MRDSLPKVMLGFLALAGLQLGLCSVTPAHAADAPVSTVLGNRRVILVQTPAGTGAMTVSMLDGSKTGGYWDLGERAGQLRPEAKKVVMLGLGGGEMLRAARRSLPKAELLGVDNDPKMIKAAVAEFHIERFGARTQLADAFTYVKQLRKVDVLLVDLFVGDTMPPKMLNANFWRDCRAAIGAKGLIAVNVYPLHLVSQVEALLAAVELTVLERHPDKGGSTVLFAEPKYSSTVIDLGGDMMFARGVVLTCEALYPVGRCFYADGGLAGDTSSINTRPYAW